jgi:hypothetical protein
MAAGDSRDRVDEWCDPVRELKEVAMSPSITGPVEVLAWHFSTPEEAIDALSALDVFQNDSSVRLLDLVVGTQEADALAFIEVEAKGPGSGGVIELPEHSRGLIAHEDVDGLASELDLDEGGSVLVVALEHLWAERIGSAMLAAGGTSTLDEFVPGSNVDNILAAATAEAGA